MNAILNKDTALHYCDSCNAHKVAVLTVFDDKIVARCNTCLHETSYWKVKHDIGKWINDLG